MKNPAPILMTTYRRLTHIKRSVEALRRNDLAPDSILYLTSDGPMPGDQQQVEVVRDYLKTVDGFKDVILSFREKNDRMGNWLARREILEKHGHIIHVEEDCESAPGFLAFMNDALSRNKDNQHIFSVHGYVPPLPSLRNKPDCLMLLPRFNAWGFGIWKDRNLKIQPRMPREEYLRILRSWRFNFTLLNRTGTNVMAMYREIAASNLMANDAMATYAMIRDNQRSIYPTRPFIRNFGFDGTGEHCGNDSRCDVELIDRYNPTHYSNDPVEFKDAIVDLSRFYSGGQKGKWKYLSRRLRGRYKPV